MRKESSRSAAEHLLTTWLARVSDLRDLSRPVRRKSHYPTVAALKNALLDFIRMSGETDQLLDHLTQELNDIRDYCHRERLHKG